MELTVLSILTTTPLRNPCEGWDPMPIISTPLSVISPTTAPTFAVPISTPTTMRCFFAMMLCCNLRAMNFLFTAASVLCGPLPDRQNSHPKLPNALHVPSKALKRGPPVVPCLPSPPNPCVTPRDKPSCREPHDRQPQNGSPKLYENP